MNHLTFFKREYIDADFDKILTDSCNVAELSNESFIDYTEYKLNYMMSANARYDRLKALVQATLDYKQVSGDDIIYTYTNYPLFNRQCSEILIAQREQFNNFTDFIKGIKLVN